MAMGARAVALWCAVLVAAGARASAYTVDCNHDYTDCDTELSKLAASEDDEVLSPKSPAKVEISTAPTTTTSTVILTELTTKIPELIIEKKTEESDMEATEITEAKEGTAKHKPRLLNLNVDELRNFANALHNQTNDGNIKKNIDLSDVNLDGDEDEEPLKHDHKHNKNIPDKFYANLQAPFHTLMAADRGSDEIEMCKENDISYRLGERVDRGCEETCECSPGGTFDCSPRCKHPYIRRGRQIDDPLCFESPVDECCSLIACASGTGDTKVAKLEVCRYGNETHQVGSKWHITCEQTCHCERNSVVTCRPRCNPLPLSDKCINVQDPNDACCEVQVCDVSQDVHEEPADNATSTTTTTTPANEFMKGFEDINKSSKSTMRPLVLAEPIGSVKVLQNNSVQVNLMHLNKSEDPIHLLLSSDGGRTFKDVELRYSNLILNLEGGKDYILKTKETGTKFNFTITATDTGMNEVSTEELINVTKVGCYHDGQFYGVGEEFHIGCTELCECTGPDTKECAALVCPSHVGLELVSKGCVRWAPSPPAHPPNCCPRSAKCLSDGTCHYNGVAIPNWSEVPLSLTGCEERCFCENGDLDCQEVCTRLPPVPPQSLRCPPMHRPAPVNISDEDCCKKWGCLPNAGNTNGTNFQTYIMPTLGEPLTVNYVTPVPPISPTITTAVLSAPPLTTDSIDFFRHLSPVKSYPKYLKIIPLSDTNIPKHSDEMESHPQGKNITVFTLEDIDSPFKTIQPELPLVGINNNWHYQTQKPVTNKYIDGIKKMHTVIQSERVHPHKQIDNNIFNDKNVLDISPSVSQIMPPDSFGPITVQTKIHDPIRKIPISKVNNLGYFLPSQKKKPISDFPYTINEIIKPVNNTVLPLNTTVRYFEPSLRNVSTNYITTFKNEHSVSRIPYIPKQHIQNSRGKHVTILRTKDLKTINHSDMENDHAWRRDKELHVLTKAPNPYETVLLRPLSNAKIDLSSISNSHTKPHIAGKPHSALGFENFLSQMEVESEINRNLGRSADKNQDISTAVPKTPPGFPPIPSQPQQPPFLPTIPPEINFPRDDDIPDYDQNNIHRPVNTLEPGIQGLPPGFTVPPNYGEDNKKLSVISLQSDSPTSVKMLFGLPPLLVGLRGSVDLRYTDKADEDIAHWYSQVFAPADEVLTTPRLEFRLTGLKPSTTYKIRGKLYLHNLPVEPESEIYSVRTQDLTTIGPVEEKRKEIDSRLTVVDVNDTTALVSWRHFSEDELQFIDGTQIRYRPVGTPIYSMTELLHHSRSAVELHDLRPGSRYEASLVLVPPPRATTELHDPGRVEFTTSPYVDPYNWTVTVEARAVGSEAAEVTWRGIPSPAERWVRVYRAAHACGPAATRKEHDAFRLATRELPPTITLTGLEPNTRCRIWLELFLTNGKVKTSNVLEINTKSLDSPEPIDNVIEASSVAGSRGSPRGDYYGALVVVGVVAALGALTSLLLLLVVVRRHRPRSVPITPVPTAPRESSLPPYDNPAYKLELQQETMDL